MNLAINDFQHSVAAKPTEVGYNLLAKAFDQAGRKDEAQAARERAKLLSNQKAGSPAQSEGLLAQ